MSWEFRLIDRVEPSGDKYVQLMEVYYEEDGRMSVGEAGLIAYTKEELTSIVSMMQDALEKPSISYKDITGYDY